MIMMLRAPGPCTLVALVLALVQPLPATGQVTVTYVANAGFLVEGGGRKVLIDGLFDSGIPGYPRIPDDLRPDLEAARAPYDGVALVLITHEHADHFGPRAVGRYIAANTTARVISTARVAEQLRRNAADRPEILARIEVADLAPAASVRLARNGVRVRVMDLHHGHDSATRNLGFLVEIGGMKVLHVGDTEVTRDEIRPHGLLGESIDVALLPSWLLVYDKWIEVVREEIRPRSIVVMHVAEPDAPSSYFGTHGSYDAQMRILRREFPEAVHMKAPRASRTFAPQAP